MEETGKRTMDVNEIYDFHLKFDAFASGIKSMANHAIEGGPELCPIKIKTLADQILRTSVEMYVKVDPSMGTVNELMAGL